MTSPRYARAVHPPTRGPTDWLGWMGAVLAGGLHAASHAPVAHWAVSLASLTMLCALMARRARRGQGSPGKQAALTGAFSLASFSAGLSWLYISMHDVGGMPAPMAALAVVLLSAYLSLYPAAAAWAAWRVAGTRGPIPLAVALGAAWTLAELAKGWVFTGFPWLSVGYAQIDGPLAGLAPLAGVHAISGASLTVAALMAWAVGAPSLSEHPTRTRLQALGLAALLLLAPLASSPQQWTQPNGPPLSVRLIQGNVPQVLKFQPERTLQAMLDYLAQVESSPAAFTLLPETAWTRPWSQTPPQIQNRLLAHVDAGHAVAIGMPLIRAVRDSHEFQPTNSVVLFAPLPPGTPRTAEPPVYDKRHLVPFGEFIPLGFRWFVDMMHIPLGDFGRGTQDQPPFAVGGQRVAINICYEDLFGGEIRDAIARPEDGATVLANVSNIAWFGRSHALPQHLTISRMRSLETGRPMLRATNTGVTAAIDHRGRVQARLPDHVADVLDVSVQGTTGLTPFVRVGNLAALLTALVLFAGVALGSASGMRTRPA